MSDGNDRHTEKQAVFFLLRGELSLSEGNC